MRAYYFDNIPGDQRLPHDSSRLVLLDALKSLNVRALSIPVEDEYELELDVVAEKGDYKNRDVVEISRGGLGEKYEEMLKAFFTEHIHEDEEIRYILEGSGYFDIRETPSNAWIRLALIPGDLLIVPAGIYHRFTLDLGDHIKSVRLFKDAPRWKAHNRSDETDKHPTRLSYLASIGVQV